MDITLIEYFETNVWYGAPTWYTQIYMAGDYDVCCQVCREFCFTGCCVNVYKCKYIYAGGEEDGFRVEILNYPRFTEQVIYDSNVIIYDEIMLKAKELAKLLIQRCCQHSALIKTPKETYWLTLRKRQ